MADTHKYVTVTRIFVTETHKYVIEIGVFVTVTRMYVILTETIHESIYHAREIFRVCCISYKNFRHNYTNIFDSTTKYEYYTNIRSSNWNRCETVKKLPQNVTNIRIHIT